MAEVRDESSALDAAAEAAGAGDFAAAERHLNRAVELEEARFGPMHPDLANILNNLGVVYEHLDNPLRAESCYRRAYAIAKAVLPPDDPAVVMSAKNLRDFCSARGIPVEQPTAPAAAPDAPQLVSAPAAIPARAADRIPAPSALVEPEAAPQAMAPLMAPRTLAIVAVLVFGVIVGAIVIATRSRSTSHEPTAPAAAASVPSRGPASPSASPTPSAPESAPDRQPAAQPARPTETGAASAGRQTSPSGQEATRREPRRIAPAAPAATPTLVSAQLCRTIETGGEWRCTPVNRTVEPGPVFFYTRLKTPTDTRVEHRWYRANRLQQTMTLHIRANQGTGYRTYSRATVSADRTGEWMVQLRAMDGTVLHEERFTVSRP